MHQDEFPSSRFERSKRIAKTGLKIGTNYAKFHLQKAMGKKGSAEDRKELNSTNAHELFKEFSKLRGTALKLAQGLSLDNAILPEEFANVMTQAQYAVPPEYFPLPQRDVDVLVLPHTEPAKCFTFHKLERTVT